MAKQYPPKQNPACIKTAADRQGVKSGWVSEASSSASIHVAPSNGSAMTDTHKRVLKMHYKHFFTCEVIIIVKN